MFDIVRVDLEDFRSFTGKHSFKFPTEPGLYAITAKNLKNPRLGPNGCGKSTLLEAVFWCLYGHTSRGLKAGDVVSWGAKRCAVTVQLTIGSQSLSITRTQSPNSLTLNDKPVDQETVQKALRIGPEAFTYAVMIPQFGDAFFDLAPGDKLTLFSQIMELDHWLDKSKEADVLSKELLVEKSALEQRKARYEGQLETIATDISSLIPKRDDFAEAQKEALKLLGQRLAENNAAIELHKGSIKQDVRILEDLEQKQKRAVAKGTSLTQERDRLEGNAKQLYAKKSVTESQLSTVASTLKRLEGLEAQCPTCLQKVSATHLGEERTKFKKQRQAITSELEACIKEVAESTNTLDKVIDDIRNHGNDLKSIERNINDFKNEQRTLRTKLDQAIENSAQLDVTIKAERSKPNPYVKMIEEKKASRTTLKGSIAEVQGTIEQTEQDHAAVSYWVLGFKRVRLFIVEETLRQLELEINNSLASLGLLDWHIELDVERENKSGGITKGFTVLVHAPGAPGPVKFETWSGGETQRLRLAGDLGLANLIMERAGLTSTIECFDEPSRHLSQEGMLDLAETLHQRAIDQNKRILVIEHNLLDYPYTGAITIVKDANGSRIEPN